MPPAARRTVTLASDITLSLTDVGTGPPVLVLHGGGGPAKSSVILDRLVHSHRVILPTHPGWDGTPRPKRLASVAALARVYLELLESEELRDVSVVAPSFGGWVAAELAISAADYLRRLVLIDPIGPRIDRHHVRVPPDGQPLDVAYAYGGPDLTDPGLLPRLAGVAVATLMIWGTDDPVVPPDYGRRYAAGIPECRFELIPGAGHLPHHEAPVETFALIRAFLDD